MSNGLNQQTSIGGSAASWDSKGNLTAEPQSGRTYGYSSENLLTSASGGVALAYDSLLRLFQVSGAATTKFAYDGVNAIAEYDAANALQRRFVFGPGVDEPIVQYDSAGARTWLLADERGSIVSSADDAGSLIAVNRYDEYGKPGASNVGRFQYTGQKWIGEAGRYDYKARDYVPHLGIFAQTDPIGYGPSPNLYAYVLNDPVNLVDPLGLTGCGQGQEKTKQDGGAGGGGCDPIIITGTRIFGGGTLGAGKPVVGARPNPQPKPKSKPKPHSYEVDRDTLCPAPEVFQDFKEKGGSAPGAPAIKKEGWTHGIRLYGDNPISQFVDSRAMTIINVTEPGHRYHPGKVTIQVTRQGQGSNISIVGEGTGPNPTENEALGYSWFGGKATLIQQGCMGVFTPNVG